MSNSTVKQTVLHAAEIGKDYKDGQLETSVLHGLNLEVSVGERVAIVGASGSGKSTLLHILAGLDKPTTGAVELNGQAFSNKSGHQRGKLRNQHMGFVYQFHHLLPELTALENVMMPLRIRRTSVAEAEAQATKLLERVGLSERMHHKPTELSGGERQRVSIARALITEPAIVLADEPTGNLDHDSAEQVFQMMMALNSELETALLIVTHDHELAARMDRTLTLADGQLHSESNHG